MSPLTALGYAVAEHGYRVSFLDGSFGFDLPVNGQAEFRIEVSLEDTTIVIKRFELDHGLKYQIGDLDLNDPDSIDNLLKLIRAHRNIVPRIADHFNHHGLGP